VLTAANVIGALKIAVLVATCLLLASLTALLRGNIKLHGRINFVFFVATLTALLALEVAARLIQPDLFHEYFQQPGAEAALAMHLGFSLPAALLLPFMLYTGLKHKRRAHLALAAAFGIFWTGTVVTGVFFLP
jgi:uncharacterized membrane protein YozB (DUF420 family)